MKAGPARTPRATTRPHPTDPHGSFEATCWKLRGARRHQPPGRPIEMRSPDQTSSDSNPATAKPPSSMDQSPLSNPRSRPSLVSRKFVASRNMGTTLWFGVVVCVLSDGVSVHQRNVVLARAMALGCCTAATVGDKLHLA